MTKPKLKHLWKITALVGVALATPSIAWTQSINESKEECQRFAGINFDLIKIEDQNICITNLAEDYEERVFPTISEKKCDKISGVFIPENKSHVCLGTRGKKKNGYVSPTQNHNLLLVSYLDENNFDNFSFYEATRMALHSLGLKQYTIKKSAPYHPLDVEAEIGQFSSAIKKPFGHLGIFGRTSSKSMENFKLMGCLNPKFSSKEIKEVLQQLSVTEFSLNSKYVNNVGNSIRCPLAVKNSFKETNPDWKEKALKFNFDDYNDAYLSTTVGEVTQTKIEEQTQLAINKAAYANNPFVHEAVKNGDVSELKSLIRQGRTVDLNDNDGMTPLQWASSSPNVEIIQLLLEAGANPNHIGKNGNTPLHQAAYNNQGDVIRLLVASGADIKAETSQGSTPYSTALASDSYKALGALLRAGENPNQFGLFGRTRLHQAVMNNNPSLVAVLVRNGANIDARDMNGETPLEIAVGHDKDRIAEILRSGGATETSRTKESEGSVLGVLLTGALVGVGIGAVVSGDVDPEILNQVVNTLEGNNSSNATLGIPSIIPPTTTGAPNQTNTTAKPPVRPSPLSNQAGPTTQTTSTINTNQIPSTQGNAGNTVSVDPNLAKTLNNLGQAKKCITMKKEYSYNDPSGVDRYLLYFTNRCSQDVQVAFCQWEPPFYHGLKCDNDSPGKPSFSRASIIKANLTTQDVTVTKKGISAGACLSKVIHNGQVYDGVQVNKHGLSNGRAGDGYTCTYTAQPIGTRTAK